MIAIMIIALIWLNLNNAINKVYLKQLTFYILYASFQRTT